jgi:hypothetical protein
MPRRECVFKAVFFSLYLFYAGSPAVRAQEIPSTVHYYGAVSNSDDAGIIAMTDDLFYSQLSAMEKYTLVDRRSVRYSQDIPTSDAIVFYAEITESDTGWDVTLHALVPSAKKEAAFSKKYDTYYRILTEAKTSLTTLLRDIEGTQPDVQIAKPPVQPANISLNTLAGNWSGESLINKIVLLRGGKGFVIFKNGATMNIDVRIEKEFIIISQSSKPNASFYPDLPREAALVAAQTADPIEWVFSMTDADTLTGSQSTIHFPVQSDTQQIQKIELPTVWKRM